MEVIPSPFPSPGRYNAGVRFSSSPGEYVIGGAFGALVAGVLVVTDVHSLRPLACIVPAGAALGAAAWYWLERPFARDRKRRAKGQCLACGYDLRGNLSGVCPECGQAR